MVPSKKKSGSLCQFPVRLHDLMTYAEAQGLQSAIGWVFSGRGFMIHSPDTLSAILPIFFGETKYKSFLRQLNMWDFERISCGPNKGTYMHPYFVKGDRELCGRMIRRIKKRAPRNGRSQINSCLRNEEARSSTPDSAERSSRQNQKLEIPDFDAFTAISQFNEEYCGANLFSGSSSSFHSPDATPVPKTSRPQEEDSKIGTAENETLGSDFSVKSASFNVRRSSLDEVMFHLSDLLGPCSNSSILTSHDFELPRSEETAERSIYQFEEDEEEGPLITTKPSTQLSESAMLLSNWVFGSGDDRQIEKTHADDLDCFIGKDFFSLLDEATS